MDTPKKKKTGLKGKGTLVAVGLLVALGAWAWFGERGEIREPGQAPPVSEMVGMKPDDVTRVELLQNGQSITLAKSGKQWQMEKPVQARADDAQVKQMIDGLLNATIDQSLAEKPKDLKQYGLDKPVLQVTLADAKGHQKVLQTGVKGIGSSSVYARTTDSPDLFLLSSYSVDDLAKKKAEDLRDKTALALDPNSVNQLSIQLPAQTTRVEKQGDKWQMTAPYAAPADTETVKLLLDQIKDLKVGHFDGAGANLKGSGLAPPQLTVALRTPAGEKSLLLGKATPNGKDVYAMRQGESEVFELPKNTLNDLSKKPGDLRDKTLLSFKRDDASRITIAAPGQTLELTHSGKDWSITKPALGNPKDDRLSTLLFTLEMVKGGRVVEEKPTDLPKYGLDKPEVKVDVTLPKGSQELEIGKKAGKNEYYARSSSQTAIFTVPDFIVTDLKIQPSDLAAAAPAKK
jgi:hypothetical protein